MNAKLEFKSGKVIDGKLKVFSSHKDCYIWKFVQDVECLVAIESFREMGAKKSTYYWTCSYSNNEFSGSCVSTDKFETKELAFNNFKDNL